MERPVPTPTDAPEPGVAATRSPSRFAEQLRESAGSIFLYASMSGMLSQPDTYAYKEYRDRLLADCGSPSDPIEIMLIEQVALAHMNVGRLYFKSATAEGLEGVRAYGAMAIMLTGEVRRTALALQAYRAAGKAQEATAGRDPAPPAGAVGTPAVAPHWQRLDGELASTEATDHGGGAIPYPESAAGGGGEAEPDEAPGAHRRRPRQVARRSAG